MSVTANPLLYAACQAQSDALWPARAWARASIPTLEDAVWAPAMRPVVREFDATCSILTLSEITHRRPSWGIDAVVVRSEPVPVVEEAVHATPFGTLRRFRKEGATGEPRVLIVAPMSGHFATLLRDTVRTVLRDHEVYVTDWHNARDVPCAAGPFGLDQYTQHLIEFLAAMGPDAHVIAVCQPCVSALAATSLMAEDDHPAAPASLTLMAGPIDCRVSPTAVNRLATSRPMAWFEENLISVVSWRHGGFGRRVYPGFMQLMAFIGMNRDRHANAFEDYHRKVREGDLAAAETIRAFYAEYMAVADLAAEFYLETVRFVFQDHALAKGTLRHGGRVVNPAAIRRTALLTVEGERDDICSVGQTLAAQDLASSLRSYLRTHYVQPNVGHYGVFAGRRWQNHIYPLVRNVIHTSS